MKNMDPLIDICTQILRQLQAQGAWLATAESCTGGMIADQLTNIPGSSGAFWGGIISYSNSLKETTLRVPTALIQKHGAVSEEVAQAMAAGTLLWLAPHHASAPLFALATTGIAGPSGGTPQKPVGFCCLGLAIRKKDGTQLIQSRVIRAPAANDRIQNKLFFAQNALNFLVEAL